MFRHERPQAGGLRQFHQIDIEAFGYASPSLDAEVISLLDSLYQALDIRDLTNLEVNSLGCRTCRPGFRETLLLFLKTKRDDLCEDCQRRIEKNPLRVMDCKEERCQKILKEAPLITEHLCPGCRDYHEEMLRYLDASGVNYTQNPYLVRGLDYYTRTVFELTTLYLGAQNAVAAGGRYDYLLQQIGGKEIPGIGFAVGMERSSMLMAKKEHDHTSPPVQAYLAVMGKEATKEGFKLATALRKEGVSLEMAHQEKSLKAQLRKANKIGVSTVLILGEDELAKGNVLVKDMTEGKQETVSMKDIKRLICYIKGG
jgi:histidyl-tRNA synthetase